MQKFCVCSICLEVNPSEGGKYVSKSTKWRHEQRDEQWNNKLKNLHANDIDEDL
jgi:hypothetical protein